MMLGIKEKIMSRLSICVMFAGLMLTDFIMQKLFFNQFCRNVCFLKWLLAQCNIFPSNGNGKSIWMVMVESVVLILHMLLYVVRKRSDQLEKLHFAGSEVLSDVLQQYVTSAQMRFQLPVPLQADNLLGVPGAEGDFRLPVGTNDPDNAYDLS